MSNKIQKKIDEATNAELIEFANTVCGLSVPKQSSKAVIMAALQPVWPHDYIEIVQTAPANHPPLNKQTPADKEVSYWEQKVTVTIAKNEDVGGAEPVWLSCNGRGIWVPRGMQCKIARKYLHILENSIRTIYEQEKLPNGMPGELIPRHVQSYPFMSPDTGQAPKAQAA